MVIQIGLNDSTSTSKRLLSFVRLTYLIKKNDGWMCCCWPAFFFVRLGQIPWPSCISGTGRKLTSDMWKKGWSFVQNTFWMNLPVYKKVHETKKLRGCLDIAHICFVLFLYYSIIMLFTLADQLQWPTKQLTVLQIVSKKCLQHLGASPAHLVIHTVIFGHGC